jgi:biotin transport system substrate-specific component
MGAVGLPVFASAKTLTGALPTVGYIVGFVAAAALVGFLASKGFSKTPLKVAFSFAAGSAIIYGFGVAGLMITLGLSISQAIAAGVIPFLIGDVAKAVAAAAMLPLAWKLVNK